MNPIRKPLLGLTALAFIFVPTAHAAITAADDGSVGTPFVTTDADTPAWGASVAANDTGATASVTPATIITSLRGTVTMLGDGTFLYDPSTGAALRDLASGASLNDTFDYTFTKPDLAAGVTQELDATAGTNTLGFTNLPAAVAPTGTSVPETITQAYDFDGTGGADRNDFQTTPGGSDAQDVTLEFWLKPDVVNTGQVIFETGGSGDGSGIYLNGNGTMFFLVKDGGVSARVNTAAVTAGEWVHVVAVYNRDASGSNDTTAIYLNGTLAQSNSTPTALNDWSGTDDVGLGKKVGTAGGQGAGQDTSPSVSTYGNFDGQIAVMRFYKNKALSAAEIADNYTAALETVVDDTGTVTLLVNGVDDAPQALDDVLDGPLATTTLVSTADLTANDGGARVAPPANFDNLLLNYDANFSASSTVWENLGPVGGAALDWNLLSGVSLNTSVTTGVPSIRQSYSFDGTANAKGRYGTVDSNDAIHDLLPNVDKSSTTFEFWVKPANTAQIMTLFETGGGSGFGMIINNGVLEAATELDGGTKNGSYVSYDLVADPLGLVGGDPTTDFNHYVAAMGVGGGGIALYVNGVLVDNTTGGTGTDWDGGDGSGLGRFGGSNHGGFANGVVGATYDAPFLGEMASFRMYGAKLSANQVKRNYEAATNLVLLEWDARTSGSSDDLWPNTGQLGGADLDWDLGSGVTLNGTPGGTRSQITAAYDFDGTANAAGVFATSLGLDSIDELIGASLDQTDATFEAWVRLDAIDLSQVSSIFETGGTTGFGVVVDNGVLQAATEDDGFFGTGSTVSYDLVTDTLGALGGSATTADFFQIAVSIEPGKGLTLFVNGVLVDASTSGAGTDWSGADGAGLGRWADGSHGGFAADPVADGYDNSFNGSMALVRIYGTALGEADIRQSFRAVASGTDVEGNSITVSGIFDDTDGSLKGTGVSATLDSGATVTLDSATGSFTYNPNGAFDDLVADETASDSFTYQVTSTSGTGTAQVRLTISGVNSAVPDTIEATETLVTNFTANQVVGNDEHALGTSDAYLNLDANDVTPADVTAGIWRNTGTGGSTFNVNMSGGTLITPPALESNFGAVGQSWQNPVGTFASFTTISDRDATIEIWFQPTPLTTGRQLLMESGGGGNGMSIVYNADTAEVDFIIDGGDDAANNIQVSATGIVPGEFNQLIAVYDKDSPALEDTLTLYLNGNPAAFSAVASASKTNAAGTTNDYSGGDGSGIGAVNNSEALVDSFGMPGFPAIASAPFQGQISIVRVYPRKLSATEFEDNYNAIVQGIDSLTGTGSPGSTITTTLGATVTLNADRSFDYDATALTADIPEGNVVMDSFDYTIGDGAGGTTTATVTVNVTGVGSFLAIDDNFGITESGGATVFDPVANDSGAEAVVVELQSTVATLGGAIPTGTTNGEAADFLDGSGHGWQFLWNAPTSWTVGGAFDGTTGALGSVGDYQQLVWDDTIGGWMVDADGVESNADAEPGAYLRISPDGSGINGLGSTQDGLVGNTLDRCLILAYTVDSDGYYVIDESAITLGSGTGISVETAVNATAKTSTLISGGSTGSFDENLGFVNANDTIYIAICPNGSRASDFFTGLDFTLLKLPSADSQVNDILGTVTTDGSTITYDPGSAFDGLAAGQTVDETITYTIRDLSSSLDYDGGTAVFTVGQTVTSSSGGSAEILSINGDATSGTLRLGVITGTIADNDTLSDGSGGAAVANGAPVASTSVSTADFTVTVTGENDAPTAVDDPLAAIADEDTGVTGALSVLLNDTDPDQGDALSLVVSEVDGNAFTTSTTITTGKGGSLTMYEDGTFDYTPPAAFNPLAVGETETDTFTYLCEDSSGAPAAATALATITINGANDPVTATANAYAVDGNATVSGNVITDDTGAGIDSSVDTNDTLTVSSYDVTGTKGFVSVASDGTFSYDPGCAFDDLAPGATAMDTFTYTLDDSQGATDTATVTVTVTVVNTPTGVVDPASLTQVVIGTGTQPLGDIVVNDADSGRSRVDTTATAHFKYRDGVTVFSDGRANADADFDIDSDAGGSALVDANGMSVDIAFVPQAADLTGTVVVFEVGGSSNGSSILLVDGIPHLLSKATSGAGNVPIDDNGADNVFQDLDWAIGSVVVVPLATTQVQVGVTNEIAVVYDIANDTVDYSVNGAAPGSATLLNNDSNDWNGDHTTNIGLAVPSIGGENTTGGGPFLSSGIVGLAGGSAAVLCVDFWDEATGSAAQGLGETVTATLTIQSWNGTDTLSGLSNDGGGVFSVSGDAATVNAALAAMEFVPAGTTTYPVTIDVSIDDNDEDGGGALTGSIYIDGALPGTVYVDDGFGGAFLAPIGDADGGAATAPATFGVDAFATITEALAAVDPAGTIIVNDGDYSAEGIGLTASAPNVALQLTGSGDTAGGSTVTIGSLNAATTNSVEIGQEGLVLGNATSTNTIDCPITGTTGTLTKVGADTLVLRGVNTYMGVTTVSEGVLQVGFDNSTGLQGQPAGGAVVVDAAAAYELGADLGKTLTQSTAISGAGSVHTLGDGTVEFTGPGNTFTGGFRLGDGTTSSDDGNGGGNAQGFVVVNNNGHLGVDGPTTSTITARGGQLRAGTPGLVIPNPVNIDGGGLRLGGTTDFEMSGAIVPVGAVRDIGHYGLDGVAITLSGDLSLAQNIVVRGTDGADNGTLVLSGAISGASTFSLATDFDDGLVVLSGTNTYTGTTVVGIGTLQLDGAHTGGDTYTVNSGATLTGGGSTASAVTIDGGGTLSPGGDGIADLETGSLNVAGTLVINVDNTTGVAGTDYDQVVVTGAVDLSGTLVVNDGAGPEADPADITVIDNDTLLDAVGGSFSAGIPFSTDYLGSNRVGYVAYDGGDSNDVVLIDYSQIENFRLVNGLALDGTDDAGDKDGDNLVNLLEFGFGTDADNPDNVSLNPDGSVNGTPTTEIDYSNGLEFNALFNRRDDHGQPGSVTYTVQFSHDLMTFYDSIAVPAEPPTTPDSTDDPAYHVASVPYTPILPNGKKARFFRVVVTEVP